MNIQAILIAAAVVGGVGLIIGIALGIAGKLLAVPVDETELAVRACLPGNNCGGCGFPGCDGLAKAIAEGSAPANQCPVANAEAKAKIAELVGAGITDTVKKVAFVHCAGTCDKVEQKYNYYGIQDCRKLALIPGRGAKKCAFGCMGFGSCVSVCKFDAIHIVNGVAVVDREKCTSCGQCVKTCPNGLIELIPYDAACKVVCSSKDKGKAVLNVCASGCMGCGVCAKMCPSGAIVMENNLPKFDYDKCTGCGTCAAKCVRKCISEK